MIDWMEFWEGSPAEEDRVRDFGCSDLSVVAVWWVPEPQVETCGKRTRSQGVANLKGQIWQG